MSLEFGSARLNPTGAKSLFLNLLGFDFSQSQYTKSQASTTENRKPKSSKTSKTTAFPTYKVPLKNSNPTQNPQPKTENSKTTAFPTKKIPLKNSNPTHNP
jgi:hypothetical protein